MSVVVNTTAGQIPVSIGSGESATSYTVGLGCLAGANQTLGIPLMAYLNANNSNTDTSTNLTAAMLSCDAGWFCPNLDTRDPRTLPVACPPTASCVLSRLTYTACPAQGLYEPVLCKPGFYCPNYLAMIPCPESHYCPSGSVSPISCDFLFSLCPAGSPNQKYFGFIALLVFSDLATLLIVTLLRYKTGHLKYLNKLHAPRFLRSKLANSNHDSTMEMASEFTVSDKKDMHFLIADYRKSFGGAELRMDIAFNNLGVTLPTGKSILSNISGTIRSRRMTAIMGPSGSGKTTFMNVLMGKLAKTHGQLIINGREIEMKMFKKLVGYVPQDDVMLHDLTVRENVLHSARIRLPRNWSKRQIDEHVDNMLRAFYLKDVSNVYIGDAAHRGVSGGQRKRVSIAMELCAAPLAIFLDEPTSGLDATRSHDVATILRAVTHLGLTIVAVIHQPRIEIFRKFDDVVLLVPGGRVAFMGPTDKAQPYFEALGFIFEDGANPADTLMDILAGKGVGRKGLTPDDLAVIWELANSVNLNPDGSDNNGGSNKSNKNSNGHEKSVHGNGRHSVALKNSAVGKRIPLELFAVRKMIVPDLPVSNNSAVHEAEFHKIVERVLHDRGASVVQQAREGQGFALELAVATMAGSLIGVALSGKLPEMVSGVYVDKYFVLSPAPMDVIGVCGFLMGVTIGLAGAPSAVKVFGEEKEVYWREAAAGHSRLAYYLGKTIATLFRVVLASLHFTAFFMFFAKPDINPYLMYAIVLLQFWGVYGISTVVSLLARRENAAILAVVVSLILSVLCGYGPSLKDAAEHGYIFLNELSFNKWASEANYSAMIAVYRGKFDIDFMAAAWGYTLDRVGFDLLMCAVLGTGLRVIGLGMLIGMHQDKQR
ncbi:hypothetical protein HK100_012521 [Physocladia obscura]|uniref:ABC transporter domain-containing protein n=1 Tax=Physocladia obscura TaxID=109957 RepID=A0AAD5T2F6_9FUNG|nr:hypothetical protein HK100_012521 [Physocladia obscura]